MVGPMRTEWRCWLASVMFILGCGDSGTTGVGGSAETGPRWVCVHAGQDYCTCSVVEGTLALSSGQYEVDNCNAEDEVAGDGFCEQTDDACQCTGYYCGADLELGTCACSTSSAIVTPDEFSVSECTDYAYCCISADSDLCFCGSLACDPDEVEVSECSLGAALPVYSEREPENTFGGECVKPESVPE